jgi:hypothetical protein
VESPECVAKFVKYGPFFTCSLLSLGCCMCLIERENNKWSAFLGLCLPLSFG